MNTCIACVLLSGSLALAGVARSAVSVEGGRITGWTVTEEGLPIADVELVLACPPSPVKRTRSDDSGRFELTDIPPGACHLRATKPGYVDVSAPGDPAIRTSYNLRIAEGTRHEGIELRLPKGAILTGRITDARGSATKTRVHPILRETNGGLPTLKPLSYLPVDASGRFTFRGLPPGEYYLAASPAPTANDAGATSGNAFTYFPGTARLTDARTFVLKAGDARDIAFALVETRAFAVSGVVLDAAGSPIANASVGLTVDAEPSWLRGTTRTAADGTFAFTGVQPDRYVLRASRSLREAGETHFDVDDRDMRDLIIRVTRR